MATVSVALTLDDATERALRVTAQSAEMTLDDYVRLLVEEDTATQRPLRPNLG